jgi:hypothetical protein
MNGLRHEPLHGRRVTYGQGLGAEEDYQYWKDAQLVDQRRHGEFNLVTIRKPGPPSEVAHAFAQCWITRAQKTAGVAALQSGEGGVRAWGVHSCDERRHYLLDYAPMAADADWPQLIQVTIRLLALAPFPEDWEVRLIELPIEPRD